MTPDDLRQTILRTFDVPAFGNEPDVFRLIKLVLFELERRSLQAQKREILKHINYLAEKAGMPVEDILSGKEFHVPGNVFKDTITNVSAVLSRIAPLPPPSTHTESVEDVIAQAVKNLQGWCSVEKARTMVKYIRQTRPEVCVEIGVYGGKSLFPCAAALRENGRGVIYGIEAWSPDTAVENPTTEKNDAWWKSIDFGRIKSNFFSFMIQHRLHQQIRILEAPSAQVAHLFTRIDFLHIDGGHSTINAAQDVIYYATRVPNGGIIVMDDIEWPSTKPAYDILLSFCEQIETIAHPDSGKPGCAVLKVRRG